MKTLNVKLTPYRSPSRLSADVRGQVVESLNARLCEGLDLYTQVKVAHWNVKGPHFAALHPLFEAIATDLAERTDEIAERAVTLGGVASGTARQVASRSALSELPSGRTRDLELVGLLADRIETWLEGLRTARDQADELGDAETNDLLVGVIESFEKHGWFLRATLEG